jgi:hypothetical protein
VRQVAFALQLLAGVGGLILLFSGVAISQLWTACTGRRCSKERDPSASTPRPAFLRHPLEEGVGESPSRTRDEAGRWRTQLVLNREYD